MSLSSELRAAADLRPEVGGLLHRAADTIDTTTSKYAPDHLTEFLAVVDTLDLPDDVTTRTTALQRLGIVHGWRLAIGVPVAVPGKRGNPDTERTVTLWLEYHPGGDHGDWRLINTTTSDPCGPAEDVADVVSATIEALR